VHVEVVPVGVKRTPFFEITDFNTIESKLRLGFVDGGFDHQ